MSTHQHVHQAPGGTSTLDLQHHDGLSEQGAVGMASHQHVHQAPGGTSTLNLKQDVELNKESNKTSVRVSQNPGGNTTISLGQRGLVDRNVRMSDIDDEGHEEASREVLTTGKSVRNHCCD
jgi:hypothetical protein